MNDKIDAIPLPDGSTIRPAPRMADVHEPYARVRAKLHKLDVELSAALYPEAPVEGSIDQSELRAAQQARRERVAELRTQIATLGTTEAELRNQASRLVRDAIAPDFARVVGLVREAVVAAVAANASLERFVEPLRREGVYLAQLVPELPPPCFNNGELASWLKRTAPK